MSFVAHGPLVLNLGGGNIGLVKHTHTHIHIYIHVR